MTEPAPDANAEPVPGGRYRIRRGDTLFGITSRAYGVAPGPDRLTLARVINDDLANQPFHTDDIPPNEGKMFGGTRISLLPRFSCAAPGEDGAAGGGCFATIAIPANPRTTPSPRAGGDDGPCLLEAGGEPAADARQEATGSAHAGEGVRCVLPNGPGTRPPPSDIVPGVLGAGDFPVAGADWDADNARIEVLPGDRVKLEAYRDGTAVAAPVHWTDNPAGSLSGLGQAVSNPIVVAVPDEAGPTVEVWASTMRREGRLVEPVRLTIDVRDPAARPPAQTEGCGPAKSQAVDAAAGQAAALAERARARLLADPDLHDRQLVRVLRGILGFPSWLRWLRLDDHPGGTPGRQRRRQQRRRDRRRALNTLTGNLTAARNVLRRGAIEYHCVDAGGCMSACGGHANVGGCTQPPGRKIFICPLRRELVAVILHEAVHQAGVNLGGDEYYVDQTGWSDLSWERQLEAASATEHVAVRAGR